MHLLQTIQLWQLLVVLILARIELIVSILAAMGLCFEFVLRTTLISQATCGCQDVTNERRVEGCGEGQHLRKRGLQSGHWAEVLDREISASSKMSSLWSEWYLRWEEILTAWRLSHSWSEGSRLCDETAVLFCVLVSLKIQIYRQC